MSQDMEVIGWESTFQYIDDLEVLELEEDMEEPYDDYPNP